MGCRLTNLCGILRDDRVLGQESNLWLSITPLINFEVVELHQPDRVMRQFGLRQYVPQLFDIGLALHVIVRSGPAIATFGWGSTPNGLTWDRTDDL